MRLDHFLFFSDMRASRLLDGGVDRWVRGEENASDHAPAWIVLDLQNAVTKTRTEVKAGWR